MLRNITFMVIGAAIGALVVFAVPSTCDVVISNTQNLFDAAKGLAAGN